MLTDSELGVGCSVLDRKRRISYPTIARSAIASRIDRENASEEMRVLYVAMTRAKSRLIMTCCSRKLLGKLKNIARDLTVPASDVLIEDADSMADWVLMAAMARTEAGELFAAAGKPDCSRITEHPWKIALHDANAYLPKPEETAQEQAQTCT